MLTDINLTNFKCFRELNLKPKLITVLIGVNGSGKSSCIQPLILLKQSLGNNVLNTRGKYIQLGDYPDITYRREVRRRVKIGIANNTIIREPPDKFPFDTNVRCAFGIELLEGNVVRQDCEITSPLKIAASSSDGKSSITPSRIELLDRFYEFRTSHNIGHPLDISKKGTAREGITDPDKIRISQQSMNKLLGVFSDTLSSIFLIPAIRGFDTDWYALGDIASVSFINST